MKNREIEMDSRNDLGRSLSTRRYLEIRPSLSILKNGRAVEIIDEPSQFHDYIEFSSSTTQGIMEEAANLYDSGLTLRETAKELGVSKTLVRKTLLQQGIDLRPPNGPELKKVPAADKLHIGVTPYGYARLQGRLVMDPKEIVIVRLILKLSQTGKTLWDIAHHLNGAGYKNRSGTAWEHSLVRNIINRHKDNPNRVEEEICKSLRSSK